MQSLLLAHSADCCYSLLSFRCGNPYLDSDFPLLVRALVHCCRGDIAGHVCEAAGEGDVLVVDPVDVVGNKTLGSDRIDQKAE